MNKKIVVIGTGISGLTAAYLLKQKGFDVTVLEKQNEVGGTIETSCENGFLFDHGPTNALETVPLIIKLVNELNLKDQLVYADKTANRRFIFRNNHLHELPSSAPALLKSKLLSFKTKLRILVEPFVGKSKDGYYQSVAEFVSQRLGKEFLDYIINPLAADVYAGNPESLSVKSAFPNLYALEEKYGSLVLGAFKSAKERKTNSEKPKVSGRLLSFRDGMSVFPKAIAKYLGSSLMLQTEVKKIEKQNNGYLLNCSLNNGDINLYADMIVSTIPAYSAANLFGAFDEELKKHLLDIYYPPVLVQYSVYKKEDIRQPLDGFGVMVPYKEHKSFLGTIWNSSIFPNRSPEDTAAFTIIIGGARDTEILSLDKELLFMKVRGEFETMMHITGEPIYSSYKFWPKAIPQYSIGHIEHENYFALFEKKFPGIVLSGSFRGGISIGDCIKNAELIAEKLSV